MKAIRVCFISLKSYPLFVKNSLDYFGGAEVQMSLIASNLALDPDFKVSLITGNYGQKKILKKSGLELYRTNRLDLFKILKTIDADVYVERTVNPKVILVGSWCKIFKKKFVYMLAHDWDSRHPELRLADLIMAQHRQQSLTLKKDFNLDSLIMPSIIKIPPEEKSRPRQFYLWVGRADDWKRPLSFIVICRRYPQEQFMMICRQGKNSGLFRQVREQSLTLPNLKFLPRASFTDTFKFFYTAKALVNTSIAEGFPNTFLQAGITHTPVLSFQVNPDHYIMKYHCGFVGKTALEPIVLEPKQLKTMGENHFNYVKKYHSLKKLHVFKQALKKLV